MDQLAESSHTESSPPDAIPKRRRARKSAKCAGADGAFSTLAAAGVRIHRIIAASVIVCSATACGYSPWRESVPDLKHAEAALGHPIELATGQIRSLDHPDFDDSAAERALWKPLGMLDKGGAGIFFLEPYDAKRIPVLFVPGIAGTPRNFRRMIESLDRTRFQAWLFNYPSGFRTTSVVALLRDVLADLEREHQFDTLFITAHSLGGLISHSYVRSGFPECERVKVLVSFSSPWMGNSWAAAGTRNMPAPVPAWADLSPESPFLVSLRDPLAPDARLPPHYVFFGYRREASFLMTESSDGVISIASQIPPWIQNQAKRYWGYDATHVGILSDESALERYNALLDSTADRLEHLG